MMVTNLRMICNLSSVLLLLALPVAASEANALDSALSSRSLQDVETIRIGDDSASVTVTIDQTAANGLVTYGDVFIALVPTAAGSDTKVTCTATLDSSAVNMQFYLRKGFQPDKDDNGESQDYDCEANSDTNLIAPDVESCTVTNFRGGVGDLVFGYLNVMDSGLNLGATYTVNFVCERTDPSGGFFGFGCFSQEETVSVQGKGEIKMSDLSVGDKVFTGQTYEPVYGFAHLDKTANREYTQIDIQDQESGHKSSLGMTSDHLLLVDDKIMLPAGELQVGNSLSNGEVTKIRHVKKTGLYAPLTPSGMLLVNGVKTSSYVSLQEQGKTQGALTVGGINSGLSYHFINHVALSPIRMICVGISPNLCGVHNINEESGYPSFVSFWFHLVAMFEELSVPVQILLLAVFSCVVGPFYAMESIFGARYFPSLVLGAGVLFAFWKRNATTPKLKMA